MPGQPVRMSARHVDDRERRARIGVRHALAPPCHAATIEAAADTMTVLHATDPATIHLAAWARVPDLTVADVGRALDQDRTLVRQLSMRQTLFATPRDLLPAVMGSAAPRTAHQHLRPLLRDLDLGGPLGPGRAIEWLAAARSATIAYLASGQEISAKQLAADVPEAAGSVERAAGTRWSGTYPVAPRLLSQLHLEGAVSRARNAGPWQTSRPLWTSTEAWLGQRVAPLSAREGYAELVRRWLWTFGPGTVEDVQWWLGATKTIVRQALSDLDAVPVTLDGGDIGWLGSDDLDEVASPGPWQALLPVLDPTVMGWKGREFYLGPHRGALFDSVGNAGCTAWVDGQIVGGWWQDADQVVRLRLLEQVDRPTHQRLLVEAERLTTWLDGTRAFPVNPAAPPASTRLPPPLPPRRPARSSAPRPPQTD